MLLVLGDWHKNKVKDCDLVIPTGLLSPLKVLCICNSMNKVMRSTSGESLPAPYFQKQNKKIKQTSEQNDGDHPAV